MCLRQSVRRMKWSFGGEKAGRMINSHILWAKETKLKWNRMFFLKKKHSLLMEEKVEIILSY